MSCARFLAAACMCMLLLTQSQPANASDDTPQQPEPRKLLFDTDPGGDDSFALLWLQSLARQGHVEIVAVTTVAGNVGGDLTFDNASRILALGGFEDVEVGRCRAADKHRDDAAHIHGTDGMGNLARTLPAGPHRMSDAAAADDVIIEKLQTAPGEITVVAVGPLTNLAAAERKRPGILSMAREVVVMGGAFHHRGNITSQAEFNVFCDPEAADTVLASRNDIVILPLDVTTRIIFGAEHAEAVRESASNTAIADFLVALSGFLTKTTMGYRDTEGVAGFHVHDAATLAYLFYPETLLLRRAKVRVEVEGRWTRGQTVVDDRHGVKSEANAWVAMQVDSNNLLAILVEDFKLLCEAE